jgi:hypothetical protein
MQYISGSSILLYPTRTVRNSCGPPVVILGKTAEALVTLDG